MNGTVSIPVFVTIILAIVGFSFSVGLYVGRADLAAEIRVLSERLAAHEEIEVHSGAVRRDVYNGELDRLRERVNTNTRSIENLRELHPR